MNDACRLDAFTWLASTFLGQAGGQFTATAADLAACDMNEVISISYRCVSS